MPEIGNNLTVIFILALLIFIYIGWLHRTYDEDEFHTVHRKAGTIRTAFSLFTVVGAPHFAVFTTLSFFYGWSVLLFYLGSLSGFFILSSVAKPIRSHIASDSHSFADVAFSHLGKNVAFSLTILALFFLIGVIVSQVVLGAQLLTEIADFNYRIAVIVLVIAILGYLFWGGYRALLITDVIQGAIMFVITVLLAWYLIDTTPSFQSVFEIDLESNSPPLGFIVMFFLGGVLIEMGAPQNWQRILTARSDRIAINSLRRGGLLIFTWGIFVVSVGNSIVEILPDVDPQIAFISLVVNGLPFWMIGLVVVLLLVALVSTADSAMFIASIMGQKELNRLNQHPKDSLKIFNSRLWLFALTIIVGGLSITLDNLVDAWGILVNIGFIMGPLAFAILLKRGGKTLRIRKYVYFISLIVSVTMFIYVWYQIGDFFTWWALGVIIPAITPLLIPGKPQEIQNTNLKS